MKIKVRIPQGIVEMRTLTLGEKNSALKETLTLKKQGSILLKHLDEVKYETLCCLKSIVSAPFELTLEEFERLEAPIAEQLYSVYRKIHRVEVPDIIEDGN